MNNGLLYASKKAVQELDDGVGPPNLLQLHQAGRVVVAQSAELCSGKEILPLNKLLLEPKTISAEYDYQPLATNNWSKEDYIAYGRWLHRIVTPPQRKKSLLSANVIIAAQRLGIGAKLKRITYSTRFGTLTNYYHALRITPGYEAGRFDSFDDEDLADYVERVFIDLQHDAKPGVVLSQEIRRRAELGGLNPTKKILLTRGEGLKKLLAMRGYADTRNMNQKDFVLLGVKFAQANDGKMPGKAAFNILAKSWRAPSWGSVYARFSNGTEYVERVRAAYEATETYDRQRLQAVKLAVEEKGISPALFKGSQNRRITISRYKKWQVVDQLLPRLPSQRKIEIAQLQDPRVFRSVLRLSGVASDSQITETVSIYNQDGAVFEDTAFLSYLHL
jgi:hypothetical protein